MGKRKSYLAGCEVLDTKTYRLGGYEQKVLFEGKDKKAPIIVYLHGGPGSPVPFCAGSRGLFPEITREFIMVYWDQLGCGINDRVIDESFSIEHYVQMTFDLLAAVREDFPENPINLFGVSWGSILAARAAAEMPQLVHRAVVYGQVVKKLFFNDEVFETLEAAGMSRGEREQLETLKTREEIQQRDIMAMAKWIRKYTEGYQAKQGGKTPMGKILWGLFTSPDYTLKNLKAVAVNGTMKNQSLYRELMGLDLSETLERAAVPYLILQGETDIVTSTRFVKDFVAQSGNPNLRVETVKGNGHMPGGKGMQEIIERGFAFLKEG